MTEQDLPRALEISRHFHFEKATPWLHNLTNLFFFSALFFSYLLTLASTFQMASTGAAIIAGVFLGWLTFALVTVVVHEASHRMFLVGPLSSMNSFFGSLICSPLGVNFKQEWQVGHMVHHNFPLTKEDPQNCHAPTGARLRNLILKCLFVPFYVFYKVGRAQSTAGIFNCPDTGKSKNVTLVSVTFWTVIIFLSLKARTFYPILAMYTSYVVATTMNLVKVALEHGGDLRQQSHPLLRSKSTVFPFVFLIFPFNITVHFEHHLNRHVPWYNLRKLRSALNEKC